MYTLAAQYELYEQGDSMRPPRQLAFFLRLFLLLVLADRRRDCGRSADGAARERRHVDAAARPAEERDAGARRPQPAPRRRHDGREGRQGRRVRGRRQARPGERCAAAEGLDLPHLLDVEADHRRRDDDAVRGRQVAAQRPGVEAHPRVREPQGREGESAERHGHAGRAGSRDDDARADVALRRPDLRRVRQHCGRQDVHRTSTCSTATRRCRR